MIGLTSQFKDGGDIGRIRFSDLNIDGHPDLYLTLSGTNSNNQTISKSLILISTECTKAECDASQVNIETSNGTFKNRRYFNEKEYQENLEESEL